MAMNLTNQVRSIAEVTKAVAGGDLTKRITVDVRGEMLDLKETVNGMTESLSLFADEVTRVAKEVGTEGLLGGQAQVTNVGGTWKDLTDNVNVMAANVRFDALPLRWWVRWPVVCVPRERGFGGYGHPGLVERGCGQGPDAKRVAGKLLSARKQRAFCCMAVT